MKDRGMLGPCFVSGVGAADCAVESPVKPDKRTAKTTVLRNQHLLMGAALSITSDCFSLIAFRQPPARRPGERRGANRDKETEICTLRNGD